MTCGLPVPGPAEDFTIRTVKSKEVGVWYHVYNTRTHAAANATTFSEGWGNTRFAPIRQADGTPVHTYYVASTREAVYMESILHDVALAPPGMFEVTSLQFYFLATITLPPMLPCLSFHTLDLPRLRGLTRAQLIDSPPVCYPETRAWAQAGYVQRPGAQAIGYGSKRHDAARCLMLFKQRMAVPPFRVLDEEPLAAPARRSEVLALVRSLKLREV